MKPPRSSGRFVPFQPLVRSWATPTATSPGTPRASAAAKSGLGSAVPNLGGMMSALGTIGNAPSSSGGSGGGGFSGGSSGGGGGGAGGGF